MCGLTGSGRIVGHPSIGQSLGYSSNFLLGYFVSEVLSQWTGGSNPKIWAVKV